MLPASRARFKRRPKPRCLKSPRCAQIGKRSSVTTTLSDFLRCSEFSESLRGVAFVAMLPVGRSVAGVTRAVGTVFLGFHTVISFLNSSILYLRVLPKILAWVKLAHRAPAFF